MNKLARSIKKATGLKISEFCQQELHVDYKAFIARLKKNRLYPAEIFYIVWRTKLSIRELFDKDWHELLIIDQGGGQVVDKMKEILGSMGEQERHQLASLCGIPPMDPEKIQAERDNRDLPPPDLRSYPLTPKEVSNDLTELFRQAYLQ